MHEAVFYRITCLKGPALVVVSSVFRQLPTIPSRCLKFAHSLRMLIFVALVVRLVLACGLQWYLDSQPDRPFLIDGDAAGYWDLATDIATGRAYEVHEPPRQILRMPGFPLVLAVPIKFANGSFLAARIWLALIGTGAVYLCYRLASDLLGKSTAICAGWLAALHPVLAGFSVVLLSETCFAAALLGSLWCLHRVQKSPDSRLLPLLAGLLVGVATYMHPAWLLFPVLWGVFQACRDRARMRLVRNFLLICCGVALTLVPWIYRNYQVSGHLVVTTLWVGPSLYDGLNPEATGASDMTFFESDSLPEQMTEYEVDREYRRRAMQFVREHPGRTVKLAGAKAIRFWRPWPVAGEVASPLLKIIIGMVNSLMFLAAAVALWKCRRQGTVLFYSLAPVFYLFAIHLVFVGSMRYRLPAEYPLLILVSALCCKCFEVKGIGATEDPVGKTGVSA